MRKMGFRELEHFSEGIDQSLKASDVVDPFCSSTRWVIPARHAFQDDSESWVHELEGGWLLMARRTTGLGRTLLPLECSWCLANPMVGHSSLRLTPQLVKLLRLRRRRWDAVILGGMQPGGDQVKHLIRSFQGFRMGYLQDSGRCVASLEGGVDGFLSRRSRKFRKALRQAQRKAEARGLSYQFVDTTADPHALYERILRIEGQSWKGQQGLGIDRGAMKTFYAHMIPRLAHDGALRVTFARLHDEDVGYVLGGLLGERYRGLQISFAQEHRDLGIGNLMQWATVQHLVSQGVAIYDLGQEMDYKYKWAESVVKSRSLVIRRQ